MAYRSHRLLGLVGALLTATVTTPASAYLFWNKPDFSGTPVRGDEPGIGLPMPGIRDNEMRAHLLWNMRAGLNVAALQCQFSPPLMTVRNYNALLSQHGKELADAYKLLEVYFKRMGGKAWRVAFDQYTTRTYNGFSTLHAQLGFCDTAGLIGREALSRPRGQLWMTATERMREFRNSLVPVRDRLFGFNFWVPPRTLPPLSNDCYDRKDRLRKKCGG